jgi:hypothetical protein
MNSRRLAATFVFTVLVAAGPRASSAAVCHDAVPSGPTARVALPSEPGERFLLTGRVLDASGRPRPGVHVYVFQTDSRGYYSAGDGGGQMDNRNPRLCGVLRTGADGTYRVETIRPERYATGGPPPHIHLEAWSDSIPKQSFHLTFEVRRERGGDREAARGNRTDELRPIVRDAQGMWHCVRDLVVR